MQCIVVHRNNKQKLQELMTENAYQSVKKQCTDKQLVWKFVKQIVSPRIVDARIEPVLTKETLFAQITVRINARQLFGVRHRFGKLLRGDDWKERDVIDYVILERHIVEALSVWRVCGKVAPEQISTQTTS
ncbi:large ribosomal subunit protein mL45-like [Corticium candelabrum]|uniref:large ribosomal subunit protein mL45-like n=1 Tax=Corticium candelabrum TaxID=121492 RepID=UPI002E255ECD|nr:large ribosomal subunit protein mL45-like [Corticium candelabrum]